MSKKEIASQVLSKTNIYKLILKIRSSLFSEVRILAYHRILDVDDKENYLFDLDLISASISDFKWQMAHVKKYYNPISFKQLIRHYEEKITLPKNPIIITFDDGFADNYYNAYPILKELAIPATIFISTDYIGRSNTFWFDWISFVINRYPGNEIKIDTLNKKIILDDCLIQRRVIGDKFINDLKKLNNNIRLEVMKELQDKYEYLLTDEDDRIRNLSYPLNWDQIIEMSENGIEFGSHTTSHPILTKLKDSDLKDELINSKNILQEKLGKDISILAYPNGLINDYNENVIKITKLAGYKIALTYIAGLNQLKNFDKYQMRRIPIEPKTSRNRFSVTLVMPELFW